MQSNAISKFTEEELSTYNNNSKIYMPNMGLVDVKSVDSTANVINKVETNVCDLELIKILLIIIT